MSILILIAMAASALFQVGSLRANDRWMLENSFLARSLSTEHGVLRTLEIVNKRAGVTSRPTLAPEFRLRLSQGTGRPETAFTLTAEDFKVVQAAREVAAREGDALVFNLENQKYQLAVQVRYELSPDDFYLRKRITLTSGKPVVLERIDVEALSLADAYQPYTMREISATGPSHVGLGEPLYTSASATFWGIEFPAADNQVKDGALSAGYLWGRELAANQTYAAYPAVMGVADKSEFIQDAFFEYIDRIRIRPLRLQVQYNTWFDHGSKVTAESFAASVAKIHDELVVRRGNRPLNIYVIDDGWQDAGADWSNKVWQVNRKFDADFASSRKAVADAQSQLGLWLSPACCFGAQGEVARMRAQGFEALDDFMSMAGPRYMQLLEDRIAELSKSGVGYFKFDGLFGHALIRDYELHGGKYQLPEMPQLGLEGFKSADKRLNDAKYDELKIYYLTAGTERLIRIFKRVAKEDPKTFIAITNGAYLSPWWLMYVDVVWLINSYDGASVLDRDGCYYGIWQREKTQFPMCSIFNHEPRKDSPGGSKEAFRRYLYLHLSRGTGFVELYIKPSVLLPDDWDVISEGLHWAEDMFPAFKRSRMHGGDPGKREVYGYTGWSRTRGYISINNPANKAATYTVKLDRSFGLLPDSGPFNISSPLAGATSGLPTSCQFGDTLTFQMKPFEIRIVDCKATTKDVSRPAQ